MPRIIRSSGVNIERARSIVAPLRGGREADAPHAAPEPRPYELEKIKASADLIVQEILDKARNDADSMLVDARQETINVLQDAVREGWEQGMQDALKEMKAIEDGALLEIDEAMETMIRERHELLKSLERDVLELVFDIVDKVLDVEMDRSDAWIASMVNTALEQVQGDDSAVLRVAEASREKVLSISSKMMESAGRQPSRLVVVSDARLPRGGCVLVTEQGTVNNTVEEKSEKLKSLLREST